MAGCPHPADHGRVMFYADLLADFDGILDEPYSRHLEGKVREFRFRLGRQHHRHERSPARSPFRVEAPAHGVRIDVAAGTRLLDALQSAGVEMMYDCRRGECGLCRVSILDVAGKVDHRDVFLGTSTPTAERCARAPPASQEPPSPSTAEHTKQPGGPAGRLPGHCFEGH
ncbi:2Fe-2S iron-sulfur cluster-binding protein [Streptomyces sp. UG1]|uniref:2Fe-2S iron-sulfur cluster-binding protein n=1 Tax=Streptomyces sp. UG1 TaxID=3417652 RepID=UPI003CF4903F